MADEKQKATKVTYKGTAGAYMIVSGQRFDRGQTVEVTDADLLKQLQAYPDSQFEIKG